MRRIPAGYKCHGRYYDFEFEGGRYPARACLELTAVSAGKEPDAIFVMMNPGSSAPAEPGLFDAAYTIPSTCSHIAHPDNTQIRLVELMKRLNWQKLRILNLSDLRHPKSEEFIALAAQLESAAPSHSIFCPTRTKELDSLLKRRAGAPIIAAWGVSPKLEFLARKAIAALPCVPLGLRHEKNPFGYRHPLPRTMPAQALWLEQMIELLQES